MKKILATQGDVDEIIKVFNISFPHSIKWKLKWYCKKWLYYNIDNQSCEIWIIKENNSIVGVLIMVNDYKNYEAVNKKVLTKIYLGINLIYYTIFNFNKRVVKKKYGSIVDSVDMEYLTNSGCSCLKSISIEQLAIIPKYQGKGKGKYIVDFAKQRAKEQGYDKLSLLVEKENKIAYELYKKMGFVEVN